MVNIGNYNTLQVLRVVDFGVYLDGGEKGDILLPLRYVPQNYKIGDEIDVFVYYDSEDRIIATTERPYALVGEFAVLKVNSVNSVGVFLDWGLASKELLVPFREQRVEMFPGKRAYRSNGQVKSLFAKKTGRLYFQSGSRYFGYARDGIGF